MLGVPQRLLLPRCHCSNPMREWHKLVNRRSSLWIVSGSHLLERWSDSVHTLREEHLHCRDWLVSVYRAWATHM